MLNELEVKTVEVPAEIEREGRELSLQAETFQVTDAESYRRATEFVSKICVPFVSKIEEFFENPIRSAFALHKDLCAKKKKALEDPTRAREIIDRKKGAWEMEERRKELKRIQDEAIERARLDKIRQDEEAKREKERQEAQRVAEEAARKVAEDRKLQEAQEAEKMGDLVARDAIMEQEVKVPVIEVARQAEPVLPPPPPPPPPSTLPPKTSESKSSVVWTWELVNQAEVERDYLMVSQTAINKVVKALGPKAAEIVGGIRVYEDIRYSYKKPGGK